MSILDSRSSIQDTIPREVFFGKKAPELSASQKMMGFAIHSIPEGGHEIPPEYTEMSLKFERKSIEHLSSNDKTELLGRINLERLPSGINVAWCSGLLVHDGKMSETPELICLPLKEEQNDQLRSIASDNFDELRSQVEMILAERLAKEKTTFAGMERDDPKLKKIFELMQIGPDQPLHFFVHGWTGSHIEFLQHMAEMVDGLNANFKDRDTWKTTMYSKLVNEVAHSRLEMTRENITSIVDYIGENWGAFDPTNHVIVGLGIQGAMGTTPEEIYARKGGTSYSNEDVEPNDVVDQIGSAIYEFSRTISSKLPDNMKNALGNVDQVLTKIANLWGHSMGGWYVLRCLDKDSFLSGILDAAGNDTYRVNSMNPLFLGSKPSEAELARLGEYLSDDQVEVALKSVAMHKNIGVRELVKGAPQLLKAKFMQKLNEILAISRRTQDYLMGSMRGVVANAVHDDTTKNSLQQQYVLNEKLLEKQDMVIKSQDHGESLIEAARKGRLTIWNGSKDKRILNELSIRLLMKLLKQDRYIETTDHTISPEKMWYLAPMLVMPSNGTGITSGFDMGHIERMIPHGMGSELIKNVLPDREDG